VAYTNSEKEAAALRIIRAQPRFKKSSLATRRVDTTYADIAELVRTSLFYEPDAVFYLVYLSSNYYTRSVSSTIAVVNDLLDVLDDLLIPDRPIDDVSPLSDVRRALQDMEAALKRSGAISTPSWSRYTASLDRSRDVVGRAVKASRVPISGTATVTDIVRPRSEARGLVGSYLTSLKEAHARILDAVDYLLSAYSSYTAAGVSRIVAQTQVTRARADVEALENDLEPLTPLERVPKARDALLRLLVNRSVVGAAATTPSPGEPKLSGAYRATAYGTGTAPLVVGGISAPWPLEGAVTDRLTVDVGGSTVTVDLVPGSGYHPGISKPGVTGSNFGPFGIGPAVAVPYPLSTRRIPTGTDYSVNGTTLYLIVDGATYEVDFTADRDASEVASDINGAVSDVTATVVTSGGQDHVNVAYDVPVGARPLLYQNRFLRVATGVDDASSLGPWNVEGPAGTVAGDVSKGWDQNNELWVQANDATTHTVVALTPGSWPTFSRTATQVAADITSLGGTAFEAAVVDERVRVQSQLKGEGAIVTILSGGLTGSPAKETPSHRTMNTLGFVQGQEDCGEDVPGQSVVNILNGSATFHAVATASLRRSILASSRNGVVAGLNTLSVPFPDATTNPLLGWDPTRIKLTISNGGNSGTYRVTATTWAAPNLRFTLSRQLRDQDTSNRHSVFVFSDLLVITSNSSSPSSYVDVDTPAASAHAVLGLGTTRQIGTVDELLVEYNDPALGWLPSDLSRKKIKVGDQVLDSTGSLEATVTSIASLSNGVLGVTDVASTLTFTPLSIVSTASQEHDTFLAALEAWKAALSPFEDEVLRVLDRVLAEVLLLPNPSRDRVSSAYSVVETYKTKLTDLKAVLDSYALDPIPVIDDALRTLEEHGHDRARELLLQSRFQDFFSTTARTASYSRAMMDAASTIAVNDVNEPTMIRGEEKSLERFVAAWEEDTNPAFSVEDEEELPDSPIQDYWPGDD
jgi:hypothetical protein